jgi:hypothetical protein
MKINVKNIISDWEYEIHKWKGFDISHSPRPKWEYSLSRDGYEVFEFSRGGYLTLESIVENLEKALDEEKNKIAMIRACFEN